MEKLELFFYWNGKHLFTKKIVLITIFLLIKGNTHIMVDFWDDCTFLLSEKLQG